MASWPEDEVDLSTLADEAVVALAEQGLERTQDERLSWLLDQQQAGPLKEAEQEELYALMQVFEAAQLRSARALREAVRRGLHPPLSS